MTDGIFALQTSSETVPDLTTANIDFFKICDFILLSLITSQFDKFFFFNMCVN